MCIQIPYTKNISTPTEGVNLMAKTLIDKNVKENIILPHALKTIHNLPSELKEAYDTAQAQWEPSYNKAWNVASRYVRSHIHQSKK